MSFRDPADPNLAYIEMTTSDFWLDDAAAVSRYDALFNHLRAAALPPKESLTFFATVAREV
jgi:hypothetical protein